MRPISKDPYFAQPAILNVTFFKPVRAKSLSVIILPENSALVNHRY